MSNEAVVSFKEIYEKASIPEPLLKEIKQVELILNLTPTVKKDNGWIASPTNIAVNQYKNLGVRKIATMIEQGLSYSNGDYYIFVQFGGKPTISKSPNGMMTALSKLASRVGLVANINTGCVYEGYKELTVTRDGAVDTLHLVNNSEAEIRQIRENDIIAPYVVITLINKSTGEVVSRKVTIVRNNEYLNAKKQGSYTHKTYPVPMAVKIALKRGAQEIMSSLGLSDDIEEMEVLRGEISDHNKDYDLSKDNATQTAPPEQEDAFQNKAVPKHEIDDNVIDIKSL